MLGQVTSNKKYRVWRHGRGDVTWILGSVLDK